jgi:hypothetical protein
MGNNKKGVYCQRYLVLCLIITITTLEVTAMANTRAIRVAVGYSGAEELVEFGLVCIDVVNVFATATSPK